MATDKHTALAEVINMREATPSTMMASSIVVCHEQLAMLVGTGKPKEAVGIQVM